MSGSSSHKNADFVSKAKARRDALQVGKPSVVDYEDNENEEKPDEED